MKKKENLIHLHLQQRYHRNLDCETNWQIKFLSLSTKQLINP